MKVEIQLTPDEVKEAYKLYLREKYYIKLDEDSRVDDYTIYTSLSQIIIKLNEED